MASLREMNQSLRQEMDRILAEAKLTTEEAARLAEDARGLKRALGTKEAECQVGARGEARRGSRPRRRFHLLPSIPLLLPGVEGVPEEAAGPLRRRGRRPSRLGPDLRDRRGRLAPVRAPRLGSRPL